MVQRSTLLFAGFAGALALGCSPAPASGLHPRGNKAHASRVPSASSGTAHASRVPSASSGTAHAAALPPGTELLDEPNPGIARAITTRHAWALGPHGLAVFEHVRSAGTLNVLRSPNGEFATPAAFSRPSESSRLAVGDAVLAAKDWTSAYGRIEAVQGETARVIVDFGDGIVREGVERHRVLRLTGRLELGQPIAYRDGDSVCLAKLLFADERRVFHWGGELPRARVRAVDLRARHRGGEAIWMLSRDGLEHQPGTVEEELEPGFLYWVRTAGGNRQAQFWQLVAPVENW